MTSRLIRNNENTHSSLRLSDAGCKHKDENGRRHETITNITALHTGKQNKEEAKNASGVVFTDLLVLEGSKHRIKREHKDTLLKFTDD